MVIWTYVAEHANVPVIRAAGARTSNALRQLGNECHCGLQAAGRSLRSRCNAERSVLPEQVVRENRVQNFVQFGCPVGHTTLGLVKTLLNSKPCGDVWRPAGKNGDCVTAVLVQLLVALFGCVGSHPGGGTLAFGARVVSNNTPAVPVVSFDTTVLLTKLTSTASCRDTPAPAHPATLLAKMLLVTVTECQLRGLLGLR